MAADIAARLVELTTRFLGAAPPVAVRAWDGSVAGPRDGGPVLHIASRRALRRLLWDPNEMGLARAYVSGDLDVDGDLYEGLARCWGLVRRRGLHAPKLTARDRVAMAASAARLGVLGRRPAPPDGEATLSGTKHTAGRDRAAIAHHYDLSNEFYAALLDPSMAYSSAYWTRQEPDPAYGIAEAQRDKLDLICRKLGLAPGMRLLDVGCGWGSLVTFAAREYGAHATGVTISAQQKEFADKRITAEGLGDAVEVRLQDYRELSGERFDAVASVEMGEHVGEANYPAYAATLHRMVRDEGRVLIQQMSRGEVAPGGGAFIESYIAPDMAMVPVGTTVNLLERAGLEVRDVHALREHYVHTVLAWERTLEREWSQFVTMVGETTARVWRLYLVGGALAFAENRMGANQLLAVRPTADGRSGMLPVREW